MKKINKNRVVTYEYNEDDNSKMKVVTYNYDEGGVRKATIRYNPDAIEYILERIVMQKLKEKKLIE